MILVDEALRPADLEPRLARMWAASAQKILELEKSWNPSDGSPVFTLRGRYTARGWTDWTQGFQFGSALLQFDATGERSFLELGRERTYSRMAPHVTHMGVHDHGFNNVSTWGALRRLALEGRYAAEGHELGLCELALKASGAVQARRWTRTSDGGGYIYSFNGPHSLFADTMRSLRSLALAHRLGQALLEEGDRPVSLLERLWLHARTTARFAVYKGRGRDTWDEAGRVAHESVFDVIDGSYRCPSTQQGYSPFTTWTRGQAWVLLGFAEELEFLETLKDGELEPLGGRKALEADMLETARAVGGALPGDDPDRRHPLLGHRGAGARRAAWAPRPAGRPGQRPGAGRLLRRGDRRPGPVAPRAAARAALARLRGPALLPGGPHDHAHAARGALPE